MTFQGSKKLNDLAKNGYLKIKNHGMIVNNRTAALVGLNGTIDWACLPNFNSPQFLTLFWIQGKEGISP